MNLLRALDRTGKILRNTQACLKALMNNSAYGMACCGADGRLLQANRVLAAMLGYETNRGLLAAGYRVPFAAAFFHRDDIAAQEMDWKRKDGATLAVRCSGHRIRGSGRELVSYAIIVQDVTAQRDFIDQLRARAATDPVTGLANYRQHREILEREIKRSERTGREIAVLLLDLDGLKRINDGHGHLAGNRALCRLASIMTCCCRSSDTPARIGGDEFAIVAPETGAADARLMAQRVRALCAEDSELPALSVSVGTAIYPQDGTTIHALLHNADRRLYQMKAWRPWPGKQTEDHAEGPARATALPAASSGR